MSTPKEYDAIIIGAGQAGPPLATALTSAGWKTALIERKYVGGTCINYGCTPTKTMVASARAAFTAQRSGDYGVNHGPVTIDMVAVRQRKRDTVEGFRSGSLRRIENNKSLDFFRGEASFTGPKTVQVRLNDGGEQELHARNIFINTGGSPIWPNLAGLDQVEAFDSTSIMELDHVPEHLLVLGGGYVGVEFSQMFRRFGSQVTIIQRGKQLLNREDSDIAEEVTHILQEDGIEILLESEARQVQKNYQNRILVKAETPEGEKTLLGSHLLVAVGRVPNTEALNLKAAGVETGKGGYIRVNENLETTQPGIYALGDVKGGPAFTHISYDDYRIIKTNLLNGGSRTTKDRPIPYTVFIDPQLGRVGLSESEAREKGYQISVAKMPMSSVARAIEVDETRGFMKAVVDANNDQILGCAILGIQGGELMALIQVAMMGKLPYTALRDGVFTHPTLSESLNNLFAGLED
jgi:pyruvate/2-oxoglutarate dehydrogenase complex dihydrolipoamide dehydrogenase (E3) component